MNAGLLSVQVAVRDHVVHAVRIESPRGDVAPIFLGQKPAAAAAMAKLLFSLCPVAQSLAIEAAGEAALNRTPDPVRSHARALRVLCERLGEMLRASVLEWPRDAPPAREDVDALRMSLNVLRAMPDRDEAGLSLASVELAVRNLGLRDFRQGDTLFARQRAEVRADEANWDLRESKADFLSESDDDAVAQAMTDRNFARAPGLPGRRVETGAVARRAAVGFVDSTSGRLAARFHDMAATLDAIRAMLAGVPAPSGLMAARNIGRGEGYAAVDSARGRLYHRVKLDGGGRIVAYAIVAPTEWNFHPDGPFVRLLLGARIGAGIGGAAMARRRVERLAFVFDPCIGVCAEIRQEPGGLSDA
jgi:coenzyme F420-reducing hydrogenase alpha subunit